jgi:hypothetical protein
MTASSSIDPAHFLHEQLAQASPDLLRQMLTTFINTLMSAEADAVCGAGYGQRSAERTNVRPSAMDAGIRNKLPSTAGAAATTRQCPYRTARRRTSPRGQCPVGFIDGPPLPNRSGQPARR